MKEIIGFIKSYFKETNRVVLLICTLFISFLIWMNYSFSFEKQLTHSDFLFLPTITGRWLIFSIAFYIPLLLLVLSKPGYRFDQIKTFFCCLLIAPLLFAIKAGITTQWDLSSDLHWNQYWNNILYWPVRSLLIFVLLLACYWLFHRDGNLYGLRTKKNNIKPYLLMLLIMVPLIAAASTQADFLVSYPKLHRVLPLPDCANPSWWYKLLFELSYGSDFFSIELFFRGFLVIGLTKWLGKDAILPMACFYCTIHFGKPLGECISSYFGGLLLGIVSYHTRSIYGGLMVHLGIAWLMELGGYLGNYFFK